MDTSVASRVGMLYVMSAVVAPTIDPRKGIMQSRTAPYPPAAVWPGNSSASAPARRPGTCDSAAVPRAPVPPPFEDFTVADLLELAATSLSKVWGGEEEDAAWAHL